MGQVIGAAVFVLRWSTCSVNRRFVDRVFLFRRCIFMEFLTVAFVPRVYGTRHWSVYLYMLWHTFLDKNVFFLAIAKGKTVITEEWL